MDRFRRRRRSRTPPRDRRSQHSTRRTTLDAQRASWRGRAAAVALDGAGPRETRAATDQERETM